MILSLVFFVISVCSLYFLSHFYLSRGSQLLPRPQLLLMALHHFWLLWFQLLMFVNLFIGFTNILAELQLNGSQQTNTATRSQTLVDHRCRVKLRKCKIWHNRLCGAFTLLNISHVLLFWRPVLCSEASQKIKIISFPSLPVKSLWNKLKLQQLVLFPLQRLNETEFHHKVFNLDSRVFRTIRAFNILLKETSDHQPTRCRISSVRSHQTMMRSLIKSHRYLLFNIWFYSLIS